MAFLLLYCPYSVATSVYDAGKLVKIAGNYIRTFVLHVPLQDEGADKIQGVCRLFYISARRSV
jgi:hypothetical protein